MTDFPNDPGAVKLFHEAQEQGENRVKQLRQFLTARSIPLDRKELVAAMQTANADLAAAYAQAENAPSLSTLPGRDGGMKWRPVPVTLQARQE